MGNSNLNIIRYFLILALLINASCNENKVMEYKYAIACVTKTHSIHQGYSFYKLMVYYEFTYNKKRYKGKYKDNNLSQIYSRKYSQGDSILIKFPKNRINESVIIKRKYIKERDYHVY